MDLMTTTGLLSGLFASVSLVFLRPVAVRVGLLDIPDHRKMHRGAVPLIGGLSVFAGLALAWLIVMPFNRPYGIYLLCSLFLVALGALDDARNIPARFRLWAHVVLGTLLALGSGVYLNTFGDLIGFGVIMLGWLGPAITICAVIGATNAFNMMDGIDGLAGSLSLVSLVSLIILFVLAGPGFSTELVLAVALTAAMVPYLLANLSIGPFSRKVFMGDAGSMFIGFSLVWLLVNGTQAGELAFRPVTALWIIGLPLMDMLAVMFRRYRKGQSVMMPDRDHLHHIFLRAGFNDRQALAIITGAASILALLGIAGEVIGVPESIMFLGILVLFVLYNFALSHIWRVTAVIRKGLKM
ncbi:UDP-N-acetylglucosamine--undecaprenyl-phosphate N-acetylglucosaminephosphotransferase [Alcanivorax sp. 1008]|uniref:UDP-N-acetylglucosamine--undecaprenyl-phosphate N-acetylglucosaminephosphotransferase n=1 Tax=Alcanivorax sp. 1008 TaxID=2816853 RepID=UPI001D7B0305|nr:UDP-N-acetylglucosamine--undecaprenyl-phosphate N-acetylglucosaminephosphotransferase [Alcanivorax sp. 1008]MCC1496262.1 UDP-N-acetylglucosamine--undecaprenyl-phosphate N-acetylglucosaminephosphotransferase [Alcanivorax sp. 1008]